MHFSEAVVANGGLHVLLTYLPRDSRYFSEQRSEKFSIFSYSPKSKREMYALLGRHIDLYSTKSFSSFICLNFPNLYRKGEDDITILQGAPKGQRFLQ